MWDRVCWPMGSTGMLDLSMHRHSRTGCQRSVLCGSAVLTLGGGVAGNVGKGAVGSLGGGTVDWVLWWCMCWQGSRWLCHGLHS